MEISHTIGLKSMKIEEGISVSDAANSKPAASSLLSIIINNNCATLPANERRASENRWTNRKAELLKRKHDMSILRIPGVNDQ